MAVTKASHTTGRGRQLGNVQVCGLFPQSPSFVLLSTIEQDAHTVPRKIYMHLQLEMRSLKTGRKHSVRQRPYDTVEVAQLRSNSFQYLYAEGVPPGSKEDLYASCTRHHCQCNPSMNLVFCQTYVRNRLFSKVTVVNQAYKACNPAHPLWMSAARQFFLTALCC